MVRPTGPDLAVYEFISDLQQCIWDRYELQLFELLRPDLDGSDDDQPDLFEPDDEIPF